jgi:hypothetical protein
MNASRVSRLLLAAVLLAAQAAGAHAQPSLAKAASEASSAPSAPLVRDPLERETPRRALTSFARAVDRDDFAAAAQYAQIPRQQQGQAESLLRGLKELSTAT